MSSRAGWAFTQRGPAVPPVEVAGVPGLVVEVAGTEFAGEIVSVSLAEVVLRNRRGVERVFRNEPGGFWVDEHKATLRPPGRMQPPVQKVTRSGSIATPDAPARVARASRIWVEGTHDAELLERIWGEDLRWVGVVVEPIGGIDDLADRIDDFRPGPTRRLGILVDHLVPGSKETRICQPWLGGRHPDVLVLGHPEIDVWAAVDPTRVGLHAWPEVPRDIEWKAGICAALGVDEPWQFWRLLLDRVRTSRDLEPTLRRAVEELIDFVTIEDVPSGDTPT